MRDRSHAQRLRILRGPLGAQGGNRTRPTTRDTRNALRPASASPKFSFAPRHQVTQLETPASRASAPISGPGCLHGLQRLCQQLILGRAVCPRLQRISLSAPTSPPPDTQMTQACAPDAHPTGRAPPRTASVCQRACDQERESTRNGPRPPCSNTASARTAPRRRRPRGNHRVLRSLI